jgi:hypothetical protein
MHYEKDLEEEAEEVHDTGWRDLYNLHNDHGGTHRNDIELSLMTGTATNLFISISLFHLYGY